MFYEDFQKLEDDQAKVILDQVNPKLKDQSYDPDNTTCLSLDLPFYHGYQILEISDLSVHPVRKHYLIYNEIDGEMHIIDFTNELIYGLNKKIPIMLDLYNVFEYVRFFFSNVTGAHGRFLLVETIDDIAWRETPPPNARDVIAQMIKPLRVIEERADGGFEIKAYMVFKTGLFRVQITISKDGQVNMHHEEMLIEDMPIMDDLIGF